MFFGSVWPSHVPTYVAATVALPTLDGLQPHQHDKVWFERELAKPAGTDIGAVCVERGGLTWPKQC